MLPEVHGEDGAGTIKDGGEGGHERRHHHSHHEPTEPWGQKGGLWAQAFPANCPCLHSGPRYPRPMVPTDLPVGATGRRQNLGWERAVRRDRGLEGDHNQDLGFIGGLWLWGSVPQPRAHLLLLPSHPALPSDQGPVKVFLSGHSRGLHPGASGHYLWAGVPAQVWDMRCQSSRRGCYRPSGRSLDLHKPLDLRKKQGAE